MILAEIRSNIMFLTSIVTRILLTIDSNFYIWYIEWNGHYKIKWTRYNLIYSEVIFVQILKFTFDNYGESSTLRVDYEGRTGWRWDEGRSEFYWKWQEYHTRCVSDRHTTKTFNLQTWKCKYWLQVRADWDQVALGSRSMARCY